jgi:hypothetical protein
MNINIVQLFIYIYIYNELYEGYDALTKQIWNDHYLPSNLI